jgi:hypothetical protein
MDSQQDKWKKREALENCYTNWVEPHVNQLIEVNPQSLPATPVTSYSGLCCTSAWLLLTLLYCLWMRWQAKR